MGASTTSREACSGSRSATLAALPRSRAMPRTCPGHVRDTSLGAFTAHSGLPVHQTLELGRTSLPREVCAGATCDLGQSRRASATLTSGDLGQSRRASESLGELWSVSSHEVFDEYCDEVGAARFSADAYSLLENNCNHFSNECAQFLLGVGTARHTADLPRGGPLPLEPASEPSCAGIPQQILDLPRAVLASPMGQMLRPLLEASPARDHARSREIKSQTHAAWEITCGWGVWGACGSKARWRWASHACATARHATPRHATP